MGKIVPLTVASARLRSPHPLQGDHKLCNFDCGEAVLDDWLRRWALANQVSRASRTFVLTHEGETDVVAFFTLAAGSVAHSDCIRDVRRQMPDPAPITILARLAVHRAYHGGGIGAAMLREAMRRSLAASEEIGSAALLVHAINPKAEAFYMKYGFKPSPLTPSTLMIPMKTILKNMAA